MHPSTPTEQQADSLSSMGIDMRHPHPSGGGWGSHLGSHHLSNSSAVARAYYATHMIFNSAASLPPTFSPSTPGSMYAAAAAALSRAWLSTSTASSSSSPRSSSSPTTSHALDSHQQRRCPLCSLTFEGEDLKSHFFEEVHKTEMLRSALRLTDWNENKDNGYVSLNGSLPSSIASHHHRSLNGEGGVGDHHHHQQHDPLRSTSSLHHPHRPVSLLHSHHHSHPGHHHAFDSTDSSPCKRPRFPGDKMQPCSRWQTYQRVKQNRQSRLSGLLRCKRTSISAFSGMMMGDKQQEKSSPIPSVTSSPVASVTSSPQASPGSNSNNTSSSTPAPTTTTSSLQASTGTVSNNNNHNISCKSNGQTRIWSIVGDIEDQREVVLRDKRDGDVDLSRTSIQDDDFERSPTTTTFVATPERNDTPDVDVVETEESN